jgi:hypothetical protein
MVPKPPRAGTAPKVGRCILSRDRDSRTCAVNIAVDFQYYNFVDRFNTLGLGENTPLANGNEF